MEDLSSDLKQNHETDCTKNLKVTNVKISFKVPFTVQITNKDLCLVYYSKNNLIIKYKNFTCTILGKNKTHVNITGLRNLTKIKPALLDLGVITNIGLVRESDITIDNISAVFSAKRGLKENILTTENNFDLKIYKPVKFCGVILKHKHTSCTYFNSGKNILVGAKSESILNEAYKYYFNYFNSF